MQRYEFKPKSKIKELIGEKFIQVTALTALIAVALIFVFIFKEALPIFTDDSVRDEVTLGQMVFKQEWKEGQEATFKWQPESSKPKYSLLPLFIGTIKAAIIAMLFAIPLGVGAAIFSAEFASRRMREIIKPVVELLAGIPSVVLGFFALLVLATFVQQVLGLTYRLKIGRASCRERV